MRWSNTARVVEVLSCKRKKIRGKQNNKQTKTTGDQLTVLVILFKWLFAFRNMDTKPAKMAGEKHSTGRSNARCTNT